MNVNMVNRLESFITDYENSNHWMKPLIKYAYEDNKKKLKELKNYEATSRAIKTNTN